MVYNLHQNNKQKNENIKAPRYWPLVVEFTGDQWFPCIKWPVTRKMFPFDDVITNLLQHNKQNASICPDQAWKPLSEPMMAQFTEPFVRHTTSMSEILFVTCKLGRDQMLKFLLINVVFDTNQRISEFVASHVHSRFFFPKRKTFRHHWYDMK